MTVRYTHRMLQCAKVPTAMYNYYYDLIIISTNTILVVVVIDPTWIFKKNCHFTWSSSGILVSGRGAVLYYYIIESGRDVWSRGCGVARTRSIIIWVWCRPRWIGTQPVSDGRVREWHGRLLIIARSLFLRPRRNSPAKLNRISAGGVRLFPKRTRRSPSVGGDNGRPAGGSLRDAHKENNIMKCIIKRQKETIYT